MTDRILSTRNSCFWYQHHLWNYETCHYCVAVSYIAREVAILMQFNICNMTCQSYSSFFGFMFCIFCPEGSRNCSTWAHILLRFRKVWTFCVGKHIRLTLLCLMGKLLCRICCYVRRYDLHWPTFRILTGQARRPFCAKRKYTWGPEFTHFAPAYRFWGARNLPYIRSLQSPRLHWILRRVAVEGWTAETIECRRLTWYGHWKEWSRVTAEECNGREEKAW